MGHKYVKENETFNTSRNGTVPKPTQADVTNNKILQADGSWVSQSGGGGGSSTLAGLSDVVLSSPSDSQILQYDDTSSKWINANPPASSSSIETLTDVNLDDLSDGQMLQYDDESSKWINVDPPSVSGDVTDVEVNGDSVVNENGVAEIVSYKEVTQAEYNAMPDSKLTDGVLYCIKDAPSGPDGFPPLIYDTVEREVGVWIDGKPIYQRTLILSESDFEKKNNWHWQYNYENQITGYEKVIKMDGVIEITWWGSRHIITLGGDDYEGNSNTSYYLAFANYYRLVALKGYPYNNSSSSLANVIITYCLLTVQYTKSADNPGSGTWTTQGALAHHYSTTEHIIGTWIDGKPIYEKTYDLGGTGLEISYNSWTLSAISKSGIDSIINVESRNGTGGAYFGDVMASIEIDNTYVAFQTARNGNNERIRYVTLQYTKTTD